jgi:hypothetical protein
MMATASLLLCACAATAATTPVVSSRQLMRPAGGREGFPVSTGACSKNAVAHTLPFCNTSLSWGERAADLVSRIPSAAEKVGLLSTTSGGVPSLGIQPFEWWSEGLHGIRCGHGANCTVGGSTVFPQTIGAAASFNRSLFRAVASAISSEFRALSNQNQSFLSIFAPNINIFREARTIYTDR